MDALFLGTPVWLWLAFIALVIFLLILDLGFFSPKNKEIDIKHSIMMSIFYISIGLAFALFVNHQLGGEKAILYVTGFIVEKTLAIDNVFVIAMIFAYFSIPQKYQHRVLFYGILGVLILRGIMIGFGSVIVSNFGWVLYLFAAFLIFTGVKMFSPDAHGFSLNDSKILRWVRNRFKVTEELEGEKFFVTRETVGNKKQKLMTPLFLALIMVEFVDLVFALDSIPAIFAITTDPFIVYTSNIFAILGLRALYFALAALIDRFKYLKQALAILLIFIGSKIFLADLFGLAKFPPAVSLGVTFAILSGGIIWSMIKTNPGKEGVS